MRQMSEGADVAIIRADILNAGFLRPLAEEVRRDTDATIPIAQMQAFKARAQESGRWRAVTAPRGDVRLAAELVEMKMLV